MKEKMQFEMFGSFRVIYHDESYNLEELIGKQLSVILAFFIFNCKKTITKESLINIFWEDSENPLNALKYAIHRLRNKLKEIGLPDIIVTVKTGYAVSLDYEIEVDCIEFETIVNEGSKTNDLAKIEQGLELYKDAFLNNMDSSWIVINKNYYLNLFVEQSKKLYNAHIKNEDYLKATMICENALTFDKYNQDIIYAYVNSLIKGRRYNEALKYYDTISRKYSQVMNEMLDERINSLFNLGNVVNNGPELLFNDISFDKTDVAGPLYCDYLSFKKICELEYRNFIRNNKNTSVIILEIKSNDNAKYIEILDKIVMKTLRTNDSYTRNSSNQIMLAIELKNCNDEFIVIKRIVDHFYRRVDSKKCRINYFHKKIELVFK